MECKDRNIVPAGVLFLDWNISRMECKVIGNPENKPYVNHWNISRMECKALPTYRPITYNYRLEYIQNGM